MPPASEYSWSIALLLLSWNRMCVAAFARAMLADSTQPGVWFPEEPEAVSDRRGLLLDASEGTLTFDLNKPLWQLGSEPTRLGMGLYF